MQNTRGELAEIRKTFQLFQLLALGVFQLARTVFDFRFERVTLGLQLGLGSAGAARERKISRLDNQDTTQIMPSDKLNPIASET